MGRHAPGRINNSSFSLGSAGIVLGDAEDEILADIEEQARGVSGFDAALDKAKKLIEGWLPIFVYVSEFPELNGHQDLDTFTQRRGHDPSLIERENNFEKLARVADFDPARLNNIRNEHEERAQILNRAGSLVTAEIRRLWKDQTLMVRFNLDGPHLDILVSDPHAEYPVEVNLDERSRGFRWFFAFFITFSADTRGGNADGAILLLDEPGLYLHAKSQGDLLKHLREDYKNQIIYTTHSPFMVPADAIKIVRTVNIQPSSGTTVTKHAHRRFQNAVSASSSAGLSPFTNPVHWKLQSHCGGITDFGSSHQSTPISLPVGDELYRRSLRLCR
ncbi:AAA family ATPase [Bradyrhizobium sp. UFLA05-153]